MNEDLRTELERLCRRDEEIRGRLMESGDSRERRQEWARRVGWMAAE